jgi:hypothetical protein
MLRGLGHGLTWLGWLLVVIWLFLPTSTALDLPAPPLGAPLTGWDVLTILATHSFNFWFWLYLIAAPGAPWLLLLVLGTLVLLAMAPVLALAYDGAGLLQLPLGALPVLLLLLPDHLQADLRWGIGVWVAGFVVFAAGGILRVWGATQNDEDAATLF